MGEDIEIVEALKERRGGVLGFFAREVFVVTARPKKAQPAPAAEQAFSDMLLEMASGVADTWETAATRPTPLATRPSEPRAPMPDLSFDDRSDRLPETPPPARPAPQPPAQAGVIDLRTGKRRPAPMVPLITAGSDSPDRPVTEPPIRPSHLRRQLLGAEQLDPPEQYVMEVDGPMIDLRDSVPRWSLARLQMLHLPDEVLAAVEKLEPSRDLEWVQSLSIAISKLEPQVEPDAVTYVIGHGRRSAPELIRGIPKGRIPTALIIDGVRVKGDPR